MYPVRGVFTGGLLRGGAVGGGGEMLHALPQCITVITPCSQLLTTVFQNTSTLITRSGASKADVEEKVTGVTPCADIGRQEAADLRNALLRRASVDEPPPILNPYAGPSEFPNPFDAKFHPAEPATQEADPSAAPPLAVPTGSPAGCVACA